MEQNVKSQQVSLAIVEEERQNCLNTAQQSVVCDFYHRAAKPRIFHCLKSLKENALTTPDCSANCEPEKICTLLGF